jgi:SPP1 gp7 family putative phage head morphogenesis protein
MPSLTKNDKAIYNAIDRIINPVEREVLRTYRRVLDKTRSQLGTLFEKYAKAGKLTHAEMTKYNRLTALTKTLTQELGPELSKNSRAIHTLAADAYEQTFYRYEWAIEQEARVSLRWGTLNRKVIEAAVQTPISGLNLSKTLSRMRSETLLGINRAITQGLVQGESYPKMARRVKGYLDGDAKRATMVVRTEGQRAYSMAQTAAFDEAEELGVRTGRMWTAALDRRTRAAHAALDGEMAGEDGLFNTEVGRIAGPLQSGVAWFDINCRCRIIPIVEGYEPKVRRIRDEGLQPYKTYRQWAKDKGI